MAETITLWEEGAGEEVAAQLREHFATVPGWDYEKLLQEGEYGVVVRVKKEGLLGGVQRLAIKRALGQDGERELRNEIRWLRVRFFFSN